MTKNEYYKMIDKLNKARIALSMKKSKDYATDDVLSNFKRLSSAADALDIDVRTPVGYAMFMVLLKLDRMNNILTNKSGPANEPILDSVMDAHNYLDLTFGIYAEQKRNK